MNVFETIAQNKMIQPTGEWNQEYIDAHPDGWLALTAGMKTKKCRTLFIRTCCYITFEAITWKLGVDILKWEARDAPSETFAVEFDEGEHIVLVHRGYLYQSYYGKTEVICRALTPEMLASLGDPASAWTHIVGELDPSYVPQEINILY